jgi:diaminohydroxyphosphoribosylaminopyrimidine deaminase / 5-amino-6-(5-phosphoribosylamino)uracil reductase
MESILKPSPLIPLPKGEGDNSVHEYFVERCIDLARNGQGCVGNGAMVGSVLVRNGEVIAEAHHSEFGGLHAERKLLEEYTGEIAPTDVLYVNLEPCCHQGKTPPCTDVIIEKGIQCIVFGMRDPDQRVTGKGIKTLHDAGIRVVGPVLPELCARLNKGFVSVRTKGRPYITLKRAQTRNGSIDGKITTDEQDIWSHTYLRARYDAILVGVETIIADNPQLTVRKLKKPNKNIIQPCRIILDPRGRIPCDSAVLIDGGKTIVLTENEVPVHDDIFVWEELWTTLLSKGITSMLVEGGPRTWDVFKNAGMVDEEVVLVGS